MTSRWDISDCEEGGTIEIIKLYLLYATTLLSICIPVPPKRYNYINWNSLVKKEGSEPDKQEQVTTQAPPCFLHCLQALRSDHTGLR